jgi:hypothetical protein
VPDDKNDNLQDVHNQGQTDASHGTYDPPHAVSTPLDDIVYGSDNAEKWAEENEVYNQGHSHAHNQKK